MPNKNNVLVIGDTHIPFEKEGYLDFCKATKKRFNCTTVIHIGDLVDNHACSYHEHDPNGQSPSDEMKLAREKLKDWFKAFPKVRVCKGNHDVLIARKAITYGLPREVLRPFDEIWKLPKNWQ